MSRFFSEKHSNLVPYTPGEQPKGQTFIKLNTNESPFPPSPLAIKYAQKAAAGIQLYSDPECRDLVKAAAEYFGISRDRIIFGNGSDEILNFAFMAFCDKDHPAVFPDITYGFYPVFAELNGVPYTEIPLREDFTVDVDEYIGLNKTVFIANPNAPTGITLPLKDIERIAAGNPDSVVVVDEAYVDFGAQSAISLVDKYSNLLVVQTFSKSRSMAGARLGFGIGCRELIADLNTVKYSTNPYNINSMTMAAGIGSIEDDDYFSANCKTIAKTRVFVSNELKRMGFTVLDSESNFIFAKHNSIGGADYYKALRKKGVLVRHFDKARIKEFNRITIGSEEQMKKFLEVTAEILEEIR